MSGSNSTQRQSESIPLSGYAFANNILCSYGNSCFTVLVGPNEESKSFTLHEQLAREKSDFINAAFRNEWKESEQNIIRLPDYHPEHFELFLLWIYNHTIFSSKEGDEPVQQLGGVDKEWDRLASAWVLGAYLQAPDFRDAVTDAIIEKLSSCFSKFNQSMHEIIYANTDASAPIRKLIVDIAIWRWDESILKAQKNDPAWSDFFYDLSIAMMSARKTADFGASPPWVKDPCAYHEHHKDSACYKSKRK